MDALTEFVEGSTAIARSHRPPGDAGADRREARVVKLSPQGRVLAVWQ